MVKFVILEPNNYSSGKETNSSLVNATDEVLNIDII